MVMSSVCRMQRFAYVVTMQIDRIVPNTVSYLLSGYCSPLFTKQWSCSVAKPAIFYLTLTILDSNNRYICIPVHSYVVAVADYIKYV